MKLATIAALTGSAAAFAPIQQGRTATAVQGFQNELGVVAPTGFFDPLGLSKVRIDDSTSYYYDRRTVRDHKRSSRHELYTNS